MDRELAARSVRALAVPLALGLGILGLVAGAAAALEQSHGFFLKDPAATLDSAAYVGAVSLLGGLVWWTGGVVSIGAGLAARRHRDPAAAPLLAAGGLTAGLALDDLFLVHEGLAALVSLPEGLLFGLWIVLTALFLVVHRGFVLASPWPVLVVAMAFFAVSLGFDIESELSEADRSLIEDGAKFLGIVSWTTYLGLVSRPALANALA